MRRTIPIHSGPFQFSFEDNPGGIANGVGNAIAAYLSSIPERAKVEAQRRMQDRQQERQDQQSERQARSDDLRQTIEQQRVDEESRHHRALESAPTHHAQNPGDAGTIAPQHVVDHLTMESVAVPKVDLLGQPVMGADGQPASEYKRQPRKDAAQRLRKAGIDPDTLRYLDKPQQPLSVGDSIGGYLGPLTDGTDPISNYFAPDEPDDAPMPAAAPPPAPAPEPTKTNGFIDNLRSDPVGTFTGAINDPATPADLAQPTGGSPAVGSPGQAPIDPRSLADGMARYRAQVAGHQADPIQSALARLHPGDQADYQRLLLQGDQKKIAAANQRLLQMAAQPDQAAVAGGP